MARAALARAEFDEPVDVVGHLDSGEVLRAVLGLLDGDRQVQAQPADEGERVRRVDGQRREDREHLLVEVRRQPRAFVVVELRPRHHDDALVGERGAHRLHEHLGVPAGDLLGALADAAQLLARRQPVGRANRQSHLVAALEAGDAHHVELVEIRREDRQELGPLQQRQRRVGGQREHAGVEVQPAQFAVEVAVVGQGLGLRRVDRVRGGGGRRLGRAAVRRPVRVGRSCLGFGHSGRSSPIVRSGVLGADRRRCSVGDVAAPTPRPRARREIVGGVDVAAQSRPLARQLDRARIRVPPCGIGAEQRAERDAEGEQRRRCRCRAGR